MEFPGKLKKKLTNIRLTFWGFYDKIKQWRTLWNEESTLAALHFLTEKGRTEAPEKELLACQLAQCLGCDQAEVKVMEEDGRYEVRAPIRGIIACGEFLGISNEENMTEYVVKGNVN